ncbi:MAG TPA: hypothetical protein VH256_03190 [Thermoleophilaceae bacterium]|nr:hypothetical protein [Thermoleophilaceae bacterium]
MTGRRGRWGWTRDYRLSEEELAKRGLRAAQELGRDDPLWPGQLAMLAALLLYMALPSKLTIGPSWPLPAAETLVLLALVTTARRGRELRRRRAIALGLVFVATAGNLTALGLLAHYLLVGGQASGTDLIGGGAVIWITNLLLFTVTYWELDRGGPLRPASKRSPVAPDFLFPQMTDERYAAPGWKPGFADYLYVSLTNQTAFSPTDTMPLTLRVKALMGVQGVASFITTGIIVARAVNLLG